MHTLFALEDMYGLKIGAIDGKVCLRLDKSTSSTYSTIFDMFHAWQEQAARLERGEITKEEYDQWRYNYPDDGTFNFQKEKKMETIEYLYHYTNIETLALILKNKTIRFNSLDKMDDLQEQETSDLKNIGQFCYISSWTDDETESIPMWNMYASLNLGVRIKLRKNPFKVYNNLPSDLSRVLNLPIKDESGGKYLQSIIPLSEMFSKGFFSVQAMSKELLHKVEYTNDTAKLYPSLLKENGEQFSIALGELGKYKNLHWQFQNEWRYILNILPLNLNQPVEGAIHNFQIIANKMRLGLEKQPIPYYDMTLSNDAFINMQITLSPRISAGSRIIVQNLVEKYNPTAELKESNILGLI